MRPTSTPQSECPRLNPCIIGGFSFCDALKLTLDSCPVPPCSLSDLTYTEHESLHGWKEKFKYYSCYPVVGKLIRPKSDTVYTAETLKPLNGTQPVPEGYVDAPILIAIKDKVCASTHYPLYEYLIEDCTLSDLRLHIAVSLTLGGPDVHRRCTTCRSGAWTSMAQASPTTS